MKEYFSKARRLRLTALVVGGLLYGSSVHAANLVSTIPSDYGNSEMGAVTGSRVTTEVDAAPQAGVLKNLNRDPASFGFHQKGKSMLLLRQYTYSTTELENTALIDPNSAGAAASVASGKTETVPNMHAAAASDEHIYMTGYDMGQIGVFRQSGKRLMENKTAVVNLKNDIKQYCGYNFTETFQNLDEDPKGEKGKIYTGDPAKAQVHGEALLVDGRRLYVAASVNPLAGYDPYDDGFLMQYDIQDDGSLKFGSYTRISRNIDQGRLNKFNDHILISCIGGYQHYNGTGNTHYTALNIAKIDQNTGRILGTEQRRASIPEHVKGTGEDMRDLKILPNGTAYVMTYNLSPSGSQINAHVYQTTMSNLMSEHPDDWTEIAVAHEQEGWFGKLNAEYYTKRLWLELGDTLQAYTDGDDAAKHIWQAKDFSENKAFSRFNKITMIEPDWVYGNTASVVMTLPAELGGTTTAAALNENAVWKDNAVYTDTVTTRQGWDGDTVVSIGKDKLGDKSTNVLAAISATGGKRLNISAKKNLLQLQVENTVGNPTGIYAKGTDLIVSAAKGINILTRGLDGGNTLTNAVQLDALKDKASKITINGPLNISMTGGLGGNGVAVQKSDRLGEKSYEASVASGIRINGNLKIAGEQTDRWGIPLNRENVFSRFNNAGILTQVEKSTVTVTGEVDMTVYGNGVTTNAKDSSVRLAGGGSIQVPAGMKYSYYALAAYQGAISMNMGEDGTKPGNGKPENAIADVKLDGDLFALPTGRLDVALMTNKSYLHGLVDNGGTANLYLQNGAKWLNEGRNERYYQDDEDMGAGMMAAAKTRAGGTVGRFYNAQSRVTNFVGGATEAQRGIIYQKSINPLVLENYSGHTAAIYTHDAAEPALFKGGDIIINKAKADTENVFTLFTDGAGVTTGNQTAVLNALANKLTYKSFAENKLSGKLSIGESLTTSSIKGDITFGNEKGSYTGGTPTPPSTEQTKTEFTSQLTQKEVAEYKEANVEPSPGNYKFTKDTTIRRSSYDGIIAATTYPKQPLNVDASGQTLTLIGDGSNFILGMDNNSKDGIKITANALKIDVKSSDGRAFGIRNNQDGSVVKIKGDLDIKGQSSQTAQGLVTSRGAAIETDGLHVELNKDSTNGAWAISNSNGTVTVNSDGTHEVVINGNVQTGEEGNTNISLTTEQSVLNGIIQKVASSGGGEDEDEDEEFGLPVSPQQNGEAKGNALTLQNGAVWTNEDYNTRKSALTAAKFIGSQLLSLKGGDDAAHAGVIFQKNDKDITIDNYSGHTRVFYAHDAAAPTTIIGGALKIGKAAADSIITLTTDNSGLNTEAASGADKKLVDDTLNALANKLWYTAYTTGERNLTGKAEIAEGLTTSAASKRIENITFDNTTGQGSYTTTSPTPPSTEQTTTEFTTRLRGTDSDQEYIDANVRQVDGTYRFTKDSTITYQNDQGGLRSTIIPNEDVHIDATDRVLTIKNGSGIASVTQGAAIANSGKTLDIKAKTLKLLVNDTTSVAPLQTAWGILSMGGTTNISGMTEIDVAGTERSKAIQAYGGTVTLEGLRAKANAASKDAVTLDVQGDGRINVNVKDGTVGSSEVMLDGNITARESGSRVDAALTTGTSYIKGLISGVGTLNLWLQNGAAWHNEEYTAQPTGFASRLTNLAGGSDASHAGVIFQRNDKDITIDNYSGHTRVFYAHDAATPTAMIGGDFRIKNAAAGSAITLTTDSVGLNTESTKAVDKNRVSATLNALANKLWYTAYTTGERNLTGKAEIAEGLTTSAASKRIEDITFDTASGQGSYVYTPASEVTTDPITESETLTYDRQAIATQPNTKGNRIVSALYTDNTAYDKQHPMVVDMNGHSLHLEANSKNQISSAIYGGNNKSIRIVNSGEEKALTIKASNTDTRAATGIQSDANSHIYIQGPVVIEDVHAKGYNATAIQTSGTIGSPSDVTIDGDLTVQSIRADRVDTKNKGADDGRNLAALKTTGDETKITVKGNVDIQNIKGSVLQTVGADSVIDVGGGTMSAAEDADHTKQYYAVRAEKGTVNINTPEGVSGSRKTNITGDMYVTREYGKKTVEYSGGQLVDFEKEGVLNVSLTTADSSWTGAATYDVNRADFGSGGFTAHDVGQFNLTLQNGARWTNEQRSSVTDKWLGSHLATLQGGDAAANAGAIFQKNAKDITIDNYSGHTRVFYAHDAATPTTMIGGALKIGKAAADSIITLTTDNSGLNTEAASGADKKLVDDTLNALANKLWYTAYTTGERNLRGKAEITEGLTTSAASKRIENITFDGTTGQGSYTTTPPTPPIGEQTKTEFTTQLTQKEVAEYKDANVEPSPGNYKFTKDTTISKTSYAGAISNTGFPQNPLTIDAGGHVLTVKSEGNNGLVTGIKNSGEKGIAIAADTVKINVKSGTGKAYGVWNAKGGSTIKITGDLDISATGGDAAKGLSASKDAAIETDGLDVTLNKASLDGWSIDNNGTIKVNKEGTHKVILRGNIHSGPNSSIDLSLTTAESALNGVVHKEGETVNGVSLLLTNGAVWNNQDWNQSSAVLEKVSFAGSRLASLKGGSNANNAGAIFQKNAKDITIDNYSGHTRVFYAHDAATPTTMIGGDFRIKNAAAGSAITLTTDSVGLNTESTKAVDKNRVSATLNALANKLWYTAYTTGERNLTGKAEIAEGLTTSAASKRIEDITFDTASGQGRYVYTPAADPPASQTTTEFTTSITGDETHDAPYVNAGVRKGDGNYVFTKDTKITTDDSETVIGGPWTPANSPAISNVNAAQPLNIDMNGRKLTIEATGNGTVVGISAVGKGSQVNIKNAGAISITGTNTGSAYAPTLFANGGGSVHIENGGADLESKVLTLRTVGKKEASPAVIKSMNGVDGAESSITIDGLVDILVDGTYPDGKGANEGVSAVASRVDIGGGSIRATGSAWAAIRAYGEFVSENYGTVNFNVTKGADGLANGAGTNRAVIEGDIVTNGGMGTKGRVSVGLSTADSHWLGNYADTSGYGVTPGQLGAVNLFMKNGSYWKGFSNGSMKVEMSGEGTSWTGFNVGNNMQLKLSDGAIWHNAITQEQKDQSNNPAISRVKYFTGSGGFIDMTGTNRFLASSNSLSGAPVQTGSSSIEEKGLGETGDLTIDEFNGSTTMLYRHDALSPTTIYGGKLTIGKAAAGSTVTMRTDSNGLNTASTKAADQNLVSATLNALANKLYYTAYTTGERNLTGKTEIAEGLTTSSASRTEKITFNEATGQGGYTYKPSTDIPDTQVTTVFTQGITGDVDTDAVYATGGVLKNGKYYFSKATSITADTGIAAADGKPVDITGGSGTTLAINAKNYGIDAAANSKVDMTGDRLSITAADGAANRSIRAAAGSSVGIASGFDIKGAVENNGGTVKLDGTGKTSSLVGNITQNDGTFNLRMTGKNSVLKSDIISKGGNLAVTLDGEGTVFTGSIGTAAKSGVSFYRAGTPTGTRELTLGRMAVWNVTGASDLTKLSAQGTIVQQSNQEARIGSYEGTAKVLYRGTATPDGVLTLRNTGRFTVQNIIGTNNSLTLATDAFSGSDAGDEKVAETLAKRFVYSGDIGNIENEGVKGLRLNAAIADGMTTSAKTYRVRLGANGLSQGVTRVALSDIQYGDYETKLMSGVKSAMTASAMAWRAESNDLMKRLGDLRLSPEQIGTWVRFYRGKSSSDKDRADFRMNYSTIQVGHDWKVSPAWRVGLAGSYMKGSSSYASGSGKNKEGNLGIYGTWTGKDGQYLDLIAKVGRLTNEYSVYNDFGHYVKGDYGAWGGSLSAEYGKRIRGKNGGFIEPQAELIYTHLNGANYAGSTDYMVGGVYQKMYVRQGAFNSLIGRLGIGFGRETNRSTWFAKVSLYHAFSGSLHTDYSDGINPWKHTHQDFKDTWVGAQIGGTVKIGEKCSLYGDFEKTFGGDVKTDWRMDAGVRWSF
ncbi:autotransporter beta-domain protein [Selenomonas sp. FOBRC9]|uniref:autotransporter domain-containing protein n=1 Tax=Selenomonas sp. FOBRC9 TaxID=936573 RepID=UPI00027A5490|nr:autotransporter domain-containing protein [Selenomonas sp. FOBRC9]EJP30244.1 autotransporter beta-domain protein [Selenomonas sp. FOBRC9]